MSKNVVEKVDNVVPVNNILVSVSDKSGLETFIPQLIKARPNVMIYSTGGTFGKIEGILGEEAERNLTQVSDYTGQPETQGGLVKTLDFKIYLGLLTETYNEAHQDDLERTGAVPIDMVVVNLYPFQETIAKPDITFEGARGNIDIGGPTMIRAAAKNCLRVASVCDPESYEHIASEISESGGLCFGTRLELAEKAFKHTAEYDTAIAKYLLSQEFDEAFGCYTMPE